MKTPLLLLLSLFMWCTLQGQYTLNTTSTPYEELTNPISMNNGIPWYSGVDFTLNFNFNFYIYDQTFTSVYVEPGGGLSFPFNGTKKLYVFHTPFGGYLLNDKGTTTSLSPIDYEISGITERRILKIQWRNAGFEQWYTTSDTADFVDFQIWLFEIDNHLEIHFGNHQTDPGTYGYPVATSDTNPGPSVLFKFDSCSNIFALTGPCDQPTSWFMNSCPPPNYSFIDGTPSNGITYSFYPGPVGINEKHAERNRLFPNPTADWCTIQLSSPGTDFDLVITNVMGAEMKRFENVEDAQRIDLSALQPGLYLYKIMQGTSLVSKGKLTRIN
jgi:hypothetical protein